MYILPLKMIEFEKTRQRIEERQQRLDLAKPQLILLEEQVLQSLSPRVTTILQETKEYIEQNENLSLHSSIEFWFRRGTNDQERLTHVIQKDSEGKKSDKWCTRIKDQSEAVLTYEGSNRYVNMPFYWIKLDRSPELGCHGANLQSADWIKTYKVKVDKIKFLFWSQEEQPGKGPLVELCFEIYPSEYTEMCYDENIEGKDELSYFGVKSEHVDDFANSIYYFLKEKKYCSADFANTKHLEKKPTDAEDDNQTLIATTIEHKNNDIHDETSQLSEEQRRRMEDEHRDHVLHELEQRSAEDPSFVWPSSVPYEEKGMRRSRHDRLDDHSLQDGISHHFPEGPDR